MEIFTWEIITLGAGFRPSVFGASINPAFHGKVGTLPIFGPASFALHFVYRKVKSTCNNFGHFLVKLCQI
jgi:hypothetical protein